MNLTEYLEISRINTDIQYYYDISLRCVPRRDYDKWRAKLFILNGNRNAMIWIPNKHLSSDGTIHAGECLDYIFRSERNKRACLSAGINVAKFFRVHDMYPPRKKRKWDEAWEDWTNESLNG